MCAFSRRIGSTAVAMVAALVAGSCDDGPTAPELGISHVYGVVEVTISGDAERSGDASARFITTSGRGTIQMDVLSSGSFTDGTRGAGGHRYIFATFRVRNADQDGEAYEDPRRNLTFLAVDTDATFGITALSRLREFGGGEITGERAVALAESFVPTGQVHRDVTGELVSTGPDVLQAYLEEEVARVDLSGTRVTDVFPYGFVTRCVSNCDGSRALPANPAPNQWDGRVTFAFRVPLQPTAAEEPFTVITQFLAVDDDITRITRSPEETRFGGRDAFEAQSAKIGAEVVTLVDDVPYGGASSRTLCDVRVAGPSGSPVTTLGDATVCAPAGTGPIFVDVDAKGADDGTSWRNAFDDLQEALAVAEAGDEVWVAEGTYRPSASSVRSESFHVPDSVAVYGGFAGGETSLAQRDWKLNPTILSGDLDGNDDPDGSGNAENSYHVIYLNGEAAQISPSTVIDGFIVEGGNANGTDERQDRGGGLYCVGSDGGTCRASIRNTVFQGNRATTAGGAFLCGGASGGLCSPTLANVIFSENHANRGGAFYLEVRDDGRGQPTLRDVHFARNAAVSGGAIYTDARNQGEAQASLINVIFARNSAENGGAVYLATESGGRAMPSFVNVAWFENSAEVGGGAIYLNDGQGGRAYSRLINVVFARNAAARGGAVYINFVQGAGDSGPTISSSIFWANTAAEGPQIYNAQGRVTIDHSVVEGGLAVGIVGTGSTINRGGNLSDDPLFEDLNMGRLQLTADSPIIDAGSNALPAGITVDLRGAPRIVGNAVDPGPFEFQGVFGAQAPFEVKGPFELKGPSGVR